MPPPAFTKAAKFALAAARLVALTVVLSQPPQLLSEAITIALYTVLLNRLAAGTPASGSMLSNGMLSEVKRLVNCERWSNESTLSVEPFRANAIIADACALAAVVW